MVGYTLAPGAKRDIAGVRATIERDNPAAARKWLVRIRSKFRMLVRQPLIGEACQPATDGLRFVVAGNYVVYYDIQRGRVRIVRVIHAARAINAGLLDANNDGDS